MEATLPTARSWCRAPLSGKLLRPADHGLLKIEGRENNLLKKINDAEGREDNLLKKVEKIEEKLGQLSSGFHKVGPTFEMISRSIIRERKGHDYGCAFTVVNLEGLAIGTLTPS